MPDTFTSIKLKILVFGPTPSSVGTAGFVGDLASKRVEIRNSLRLDGHQADFPEDLMTGAIDPALDNAYIWEQLLVREYDMIVNLVGSFGSVDELSLFHDTNLARKTALFFNDDHKSGLSYQHARVIEALGAKLSTYQYPIDLTACNLMTTVNQKVWAVRVGKFYE